jgi:hypothetical protein
MMVWIGFVVLLVLFVGNIILIERGEYSGFPE